MRAPVSSRITAMTVSRRKAEEIPSHRRDSVECGESIADRDAAHANAATDAMVEPTKDANVCVASQSLPGNSAPPAIGTVDGPRKRRAKTHSPPTAC